MVHGDGGITGSGGAVVGEEGEEAIGLGHSGRTEGQGTGSRHGAQETVRRQPRIQHSRHAWWEQGAWAAWWIAGF